MFTPISKSYLNVILKFILTAGANTKPHLRLKCEMLKTAITLKQGSFANGTWKASVVFNLTFKRYNTKLSTIFLCPILDNFTYIQAVFRHRWVVAEIRYQALLTDKRKISDRSTHMTIHSYCDNRWQTVTNISRQPTWRE